jgi:hypothetical protein
MTRVQRNPSVRSNRQGSPIKTCGGDQSTHVERPLDSVAAIIQPPMAENDFKQQLTECERVIRELEGTNNPQDRIRLLREMRQLLQNIEERSEKTKLTG